MTFLDDHTDARYADEAEARLEFSRVAAACHECRRCIDRCDAFPRLFELLDRIDDHDAGRMTPEEQDGVADACFHCGECLVGCVDESIDRPIDRPIDVPRAMLRLEAVRHAARRRPPRDRVATSVLARPRLDRAMVGRSAPGSVRRRMVSVALGRSAAAPALDRSVAVAGSAVSPGDAAPAVVLVTGEPLDAFDRRAVADAAALYGVLGVRCQVVALGSSGAVALHAGELDRFRRLADRNVGRLSDVTPSARLVVLDPVCRTMIGGEYARSATGARRAEAESVAARATDLAGHVGALLADDRSGVMPETVVLHTDARMVATGEAEATRRLFHRLGATVIAIEGSSGSGAVDALRTIKDEAVAGVAARFVERVEAAAGPGAVVVTSCGGTAAALRAVMSVPVRHPATVLAIAVGAVAD